MFKFRNNFSLIFAETVKMSKGLWGLKYPNHYFPKSGDFIIVVHSSGDWNHYKNLGIIIIYSHHAMNHIIDENKVHLCMHLWLWIKLHIIYRDLWLISTYNTRSIDRGGVRTIIISNILWTVNQLWTKVVNQAYLIGPLRSPYFLIKNDLCNFYYPFSKTTEMVSP